MIGGPAFGGLTPGELALVESGLRQAVASDVPLLAQASEYILAAGGKRLRPAIVLLAYKAAGGLNVECVVPVAVAVELLHTATLIHDDINDRSDIRRGQATINTRWGDSLALLAGDFVFVRMLNVIAGCSSQVVQALAACSTSIVEGETLQVLRSGDHGVSEDEYLAAVARKTGSLLAAAAELGGTMADGSHQYVSALKDYGLNLGIAFQIRDDTLNLIGHRDAMGKPVLNDLPGGKMSLATPFALRASAQARRVLSSRDATAVTELLTVTGALDYADARAEGFAAAAKACLAALPASEAQTTLRNLADYAATRDR